MNGTTTILQVSEKSFSIEGVCKKKAFRKKGFWTKLKSHFRRLTLVILNLFLNHDWLFAIAGFINKKVGIIVSVFLAYPADEDYAFAYVYPNRLSKIKWDPWPFGMFWQNGRLGIMFGISASEREFRDPANSENLRRVVARMEQLRKLFQARYKTFAGILPGILFFKRIIRETHEADVTVKVVQQVIEEVKSFEGLSEDTPIIVLGGRGFIGRRVVADLPKDNVYSVDITEGKGRQDWPIHLKGQKLLLVNITLNDVLDEYLDLLWPEIVILNEAYPEPSVQTIQRLRKIGCNCYHVMGVRASALPQFPYVYKGAIPCCAAWTSDKIEVRVLKII